MKRISVLLASASFSATLISGVAAADTVTSQTRVFRDWIINCNNINTCNASSTSNGALMSVIREAGPSAEPTVYIEDPMSEDEPPAAIKVSLDGKAPVTLSLSAHEDDRYAVEPSILPSLLASSALVADFGTNVSEATSLAGLTAALLWMDERQGRLGTTTALIRKGDAPASTVRPAPPRPHIPPAQLVPQDDLPTQLPAGLLDASALQACSTASNFDSQDIITQRSEAAEDFIVVRLSARQLLWGIQCGMTRQYEPTYRLVTTDTHGRGVSAPDLILSDGTRVDPLVSEINTDSLTVHWGSVSGGAGPAHLASWVWNGTGFTLTEEIKAEHLTYNWPEIYVTDHDPYADQ